MATRRAALLSVCVTLLWWTAVGCTPKIDVNGNSTATITVPKGFKIKFKNTGQNPIKINLPGGGSIEIPPGAEIDFDGGAGGTMTIEDKIKLTNQTAQANGTYNGRGTLLAGSTYAFAVPDLLGKNTSAEVPLTGELAFTARSDAAMPGPFGSTILNPAGIVSLSYHASGPAPVWQLPLYGTAFGDILGEGTVELPPFTVAYNGRHEDLSGVLHGDGVHFTLSFPIELTMEDRVGTGMETEVGTVVPSVAQPKELRF